MTAGPHGWLAKKKVNWAPLLGSRGFDTICTAAPPLVGGVIWSHLVLVSLQDIIYFLFPLDGIPVQ